MSTKIQALVLAGPRDREWLQGRLGSLLEINLVDSVNADQLVPSTGLVVIRFDATNRAERVRLVEQLVERQPGVPVIALGSHDDPDTMLAAMRAGARDFLVPGRDDSTAASLVARALRRGAPASQYRGRLVTILSGQPDSATAFLATHIAQAAAEQLTRSDPVLLVDLALPAGASLVFLNAAQEYSALDAVADAYRCDQTLVDTAFTHLPTGLFVLSLPEAMSGAPALSGEDFGRFLDVVRGLFALTIVAADISLPVPALGAAAQRAGQTILLGDASILHSRSNQQLLRLLRQANVPLERAGLVVDRPQRTGVEPQKLAELLQLPLLTVLGGDMAPRLQAMNSGESLLKLAPRDDYAAGVKRLAHQLIERRTAAAEEGRRGLLEKLFG